MLSLEFLLLHYLDTYVFLLKLNKLCLNQCSEINILVMNVSTKSKILLEGTTDFIANIYNFYIQKHISCCLKVLKLNVLKRYK